MFETLSKAEQMALADIADHRRAAWVIADDVSARADMQSAVEAGGFRMVRRMSVREALLAMPDRAHGMLIVFDIDGDITPAVTALLHLIDLDAQESSGAAIVSFPRTAIDEVTAAVCAPFANLLCAPSLADRVAAVGLADIPVTHHLAEVDSAVDIIRLQQLADEVGRIARVLSGYADSGSSQSATAVSDGLIGYRAGPIHPRPLLPQTVRAEDIRAMLRLRRQRDHLFAAELFADPAWDMMLDLMAAKIERLKVAVSSLCIAAAVPPTTALRWIRTLTDLGVFVRVADPTDGRRVFIELSEAAASKVLDYLGEAKRVGAALV